MAYRGIGRQLGGRLRPRRHSQSFEADFNAAQKAFYQATKSPDLDPEAQVAALETYLPFLEIMCATTAHRDHPSRHSRGLLMHWQTSRLFAIAQLRMLPVVAASPISPLLREQYLRFEGDGKKAAAREATAREAVGPDWLSDEMQDRIVELAKTALLTN
jgi:hypothetical protein